jgi:hypothetical protein
MEMALSNKNYNFLLMVAGIILLVGVLPTDDNINLFSNYSLLLRNLVYLFSTASLFLFYLGVYAKIKKVKTISTFNSPTTIIIVGAIFVLISFGQPIIHYVKLQNLELRLYSDDELKSIKDDSIDLTNSPKKRVNAATIYYLESGKSLEYYDESGELKKFSPDDRMKKEHEKSEKMAEDIKQMKNISQDRMKIYLTIFILFGLGFFVLLIGTMHRATKQ